MATKLATVPYGSRLYGTFDEKSDWDWKHIVLPDFEDMLIGAPVKNVFYCSSSDKVKNTSDDTDTEIIPIHTLCKDFFAGQTYAIEVVFGILQRSKIAGLVVYDDRIINIAESLVDRFLTANIQAMVGYAYHQSQLYSDKGDRLAKLHEFHALIGKAIEMGAVTDDDKLSVVMDLIFDDAHATMNIIDGQMLFMEDTFDHNQIKQRNFNLLGKRYPENITILEAGKRVRSTISKYGARANAAMVAEGKDWKAISHAVRITQEALDVLNRQYVVLPFKQSDVEFLKAIKYGNVEWAEVQKILVDNIDQIALDQKTSTLPVANDTLKEEFDLWFRTTIYKLYMD